MLSPIVPSLWRPKDWMGSTRKLVMANWVTIFILMGMLEWNWYGFSVAVFLGTAGHAALVWLFHWDPDFEQVLWRYFWVYWRKQNWWPSAACPHAPRPRRQPCVPYPNEARRH